MTEIDIIKTNISKLADYFESFELRPPELDKLAELKIHYGNITPQVLAFYEFCDGFNANLEGECEGNILSLQDHLEYLTAMKTDEFPLFNTLFPLRSDGCGNFDCVLFTTGIGNNSVVFNDSDYGLPAYIKASSLGSYINFLTEDLILRYQPNGQIKPEFHIDNPDPIDTDWPFNPKQMIIKDPELMILYKDKNYSLLFNSPEELIKYLD